MFKNLLIILISVGVVVGGYLYLSTATSKELVSPIWGITGLNLSDNLWLPKEALGQTFSQAPTVSATGAYFVDTQTGEVLYQKAPQEKLPIASLTKIMTMIVALENRQFNDQIPISQEASNMEPDKMFLKAGEKLSLEELLDGIFLVSANDAAEALAEGSTGRREEFINLMNSKALQIGMNNTKFINPTGLEEDGKTQYSSAFEVALMARYAIKHWPHLVDISSQPEIHLPETPTHQEYDLNSGINLLTTYPGVVGFKTGYTPEAGLTLVTLARRGGHEVLGVILGSGDRRGEARELLDYSFKKLGVKIG